MPQEIISQSWASEGQSSSGLQDAHDPASDAHGSIRAPQRNQEGVYVWEEVCLKELTHVVVETPRSKLHRVSGQTGTREESVLQMEWGTVNLSAAGSLVPGGGQPLFSSSHLLLNPSFKMTPASWLVLRHPGQALGSDLGLCPELSSCSQPQGQSIVPAECLVQSLVLKTPSWQSVSPAACPQCHLANLPPVPFPV